MLPPARVSPRLGRWLGRCTLNTNHGAAHEARKRLAVYVVLLTQVGGRVLCELIHDSHARWTQLARKRSRRHPSRRTEDCNYAAGAGDDAHGADILLPEGVLHTGKDGSGDGELECGVRRVREGVPRVIGLVVGGHWGRNWAVMSLAELCRGRS